MMIALALAGCLNIAPSLHAQAASNSSGQNPPIQNAAQSDHAKSQAEGNPFPGEATDVPVMPNRDTINNIPQGASSTANSAGLPMPGDDLDPVRSPDAYTGSAAAAAQGYSSSDLGSLDSILPGPDDTSGKGRHGRKGQDDALAMPQETPKKDISVGNYYMDQGDWKGALSRFQSAQVLDPKNPDVYWGLAECQRHLGNYVDARANYLQVMNYANSNHQYKDAEKRLKQPEIANAKAPQANEASK